MRFLVVALPAIGRHWVAFGLAHWYSAFDSFEKRVGGTIYSYIRCPALYRAEQIEGIYL